MIEWCARVFLCLAAAATACGPSADRAVEDDVTFEDDRLIDLTGDGRAESVSVYASGPGYDELRIDLSVRSARDSLLFRESWSSDAYFEFVARPAADTAVQRIVRGHLTELLRDAAFAPPAIVNGQPHDAGVMPDPEAVRYDIAAYSWRRSAGVPDTVPLPHGAFDEIRALMVADEDVAGLVAELARQPSFTFHVGGEAAYSIAWSDQERRFIRIRSCC
jgi:hypothetical protein